MSSFRTPGLASLDDSLAMVWESVGKLKAAESVDVDEAREQLMRAAESAEEVRDWVAAELPDACWQSRAELEGLLAEIEKRLEARAIQEMRLRLLALATELEGGSIVHRRALRVEQLNQLREQAVEELRAQAEAEAAPPTLPGPKAEQWIEWACGLKEPQDRKALQALRTGFAQLDDFVANLEPGMWQSKAVAEAERRQAEARNAELQKSLRARLLALASELEGGGIVHHRAFRAEQLNQLRQEAIKELRTQAGGAGMPPALPGPEAEQWIEWACGLKEPEDGESLQMLRERFARLDDFVANLEADMWIAGGASRPETVPEAASWAEPGQPEPSPGEETGLEEPLVASAPSRTDLRAERSSEARAESSLSPALEESPQPAIEAAPTIRSQVSPTPTEGAEPAIFSDIGTGVDQGFGRKKWIPIATGALLVLAALAGIQWGWRRSAANNGPVKAMERKIDATPGQANTIPPLLNKQPVEGAQSKILFTMERCERVNPRSIECWGYVSNLRDEKYDVTLQRADVIDGKGNSFNLRSNEQFSYSTGRSFNIPAKSSVKYTVKIPDENQDAKTLTLYLDVSNPRALEYTFRDVPVAD